MRYYRILTTNKPNVSPKAIGTLPDSYGIAQNCGNCKAYITETEICSTYDAPVLTNHWCATWKAK
jgi:hypothetical protein